MSYTDFERQLLEVFATSSTDPIYALKHTVPPEVFGSFGSFFSRNPKDFRAHLLDALLGKIKGYETEVGAHDLEWLAHGDYREPAQAIQSGLAKARDFFSQWYGKYSHKSIANTVWIPMVANDVSQLFARELAYDQLAFFIEQSTRYVHFDAENFYRDPELMSSQYGTTYLEAMEHLTKAYHWLTEAVVSFYKKRTPFEEWLKQQSDKAKKMDRKVQSAKYERELRAQAFDVSRFLLPQGTRTSLAWILDARSTEYDIAAWKGHPLIELRDAAALIEKHAGQIAPSLLKYTERNPYYTEKLNGYNGKLVVESPKPYEKGVNVLSYDNEGFEKAIAHLLHRHNRGGTFVQRLEETKRMSFAQKIEILKTVVEARSAHDEWVEMDEDFDLVKVTIEIRSDIGAIRDLRRHQKWDRGEPLYTLDNGYHRPAVVDEMETDVRKRFDQAMQVAHEAESVIRKDFPYHAQYVVPMAANHSIVMSAGLDQLQYLVYTRSTPQANFSYRQDAFNLAEAIAKTYPWLLGLERYPSGKSLEEVYREAPLKKILMPQFGDIALHQ